jgi:hypothetical protein
MANTHRRKTSRIHPNEHTFEALHNWHKAMFEKLGWMLLAREHGYHEKIHAYKSALNYLCNALEYKIKHVKCKDKKDDLRILLQNTHVLMEHANKDF